MAIRDTAYGSGEEYWINWLWQTFELAIYSDLAIKMLAAKTRAVESVSLEENSPPSALSTSFSPCSPAAAPSKSATSSATKTSTSAERELDLDEEFGEADDEEALEQVEEEDLAGSKKFAKPRYSYNA